MYLFHYNHDYNVKLEYHIIIDLYLRDLKVCVSSSFNFYSDFSQCLYIILKGENLKNPIGVLHMHG